MAIVNTSKCLIGYPSRVNSEYLTESEKTLIKDLSERHKIPETNIVHPKGVIVPGDELLTKKIADGVYTPYCGKCLPMRRLFRIEDGFECRTCKVKLNYDLTLFNGNVDVKYKDKNE